MGLHLTDGIVRILTPDKSTAGTGFVISEDGLIATCAHVILDAQAGPGGPVSLVFTARPQEIRTAVVTRDYWRDDKAEDVAILRLEDSLPEGVTPLPLRAYSGKHDLSTFGFPQEDPLDGRLGHGQVLGPLKMNGFNRLQLRSEETTKGFSGAPVWDDTLQAVIGMIIGIGKGRSIEWNKQRLYIPSDQYGRFPFTAFATPTETLREVCPLLQVSSECPYRELVAFTEADAHFFCGRDDFVGTLLKRLHDNPRFLAIFGPSGSGKSSVVQAGLIPKLQEGTLLGSDNWEITVTRPADDPFQLRKETSPENLDNLTQRVGMWLEQHPEPTTRFVLVVDQFEELLASKDLEPSIFITKLIDLNRSPRVTLIIVMRDDFYSQFVRLKTLREWLDNSNGPVNIPQTLTHSELEAIIRVPAKRANIYIQDGLVDLLVKDAIGEREQEARSTILPLLEFTLRRLWEKRQNETLTLDAYNNMHGIKGEFTSWANITYDKLEAELPLEHRHFIQRIFMDLVYVGDENLQLPNIRQRKTLTSLCRNASELRPIQEIVNKLVNARLLVESEGGIEIIHDVLLNEWDYLKNWIKANRAFSLWHQKLEERIREWGGTNVEHAVKHDAHKLLRGSDLKEAKLWLTKRKADLSLQDQNFIKASRMRRLQFAMSMIVLFLTLVSTTGIAGWFVLTRPPDPTGVTTLQDNVDGSLRYCINNAPSGSTITFTQGLRGTIELTGGNLVVAGGKRLTIIGPGANQLTISGGNSNANIRVSNRATLNVSDLSFKNSQTVVTAFLVNEGTLTVTKSIISGNKTTTGDISYGGGILNDAPGTLTVTNSTFSNNSASGGRESQGGGIYNAGKLTVSNSTFSNNSASNAPLGEKLIGYGGGILNDHLGTAIVSNSTFSNNSANSSQDGQGGGITNSGTLIVSNSTFSNNSASGSRSFGGGIGNDHMGTVMVSNSTFSNNSASGDQNGQGGGINNVGRLTVSNSTFSHNSASGSRGFGVGGGILNRDMLMVSNSTFSANSASGRQGGLGGGIANDSKLTMINNTFWHNTASGGSDSGGGGIAFVGLKDSSAIMHFCTLYENTSSAGGGIWVDPTGSSTMTISSNIVAANSAHNGPNISGALISAGYNLSDNFAGAKGLNATTDKQVTLSDLKIDPTLRNNGGPTQTLALLAGSPAIDAVPGQACSITVMDVSGQTMTITTDQRGVSRLHRSKNACDSGAF